MTAINRRTLLFGTAATIASASIVRAAAVLSPSAPDLSGDGPWGFARRLKPGERIGRDEIQCLLYCTGRLNDKPWRGHAALTLMISSVDAIVTDDCWYITTGITKKRASPDFPEEFQSDYWQRRIYGAIDFDNYDFGELME